ncbi:MAG: MFS transporter [Pseudorhodobacter sp.]|nr:MAG: MFS transporter [Pseudorhodobacter sp.]
MISPKKRIWGWWFFDWASQPVNTLLLTFIFGPYFAEVARGYFMGAGMEEEAAKAAAQSYWAFGLFLASLAVMILAPILGAIADGSGRRLVWVWFFSAVYVVSAWALWYVAPGGEIGTLRWAMFFFGLAFLSMEFATVFTNALMPGLSGEDDMGKISGSGFAFGYLGGLIALFIMLLLFAEGGNGTTLIGREPLFGLDPEAREGTRSVGPFSALWYLVFMVPFFLWVKEPKVAAGRVHLGAAMASVAEFIRGLRFRRSLAAYLGSSLFYRDALNGLYTFGGIYASNVLGWEVTQIGIFGIVGGATAVLTSWIAGKMDSGRGPKPVIVWSILILLIVCTVVVGMDREQIWGMPLDSASNTPDIIFFICGALIGGAGGPLQASSRTMLLRHTTPDRATEAFGMFALSGKVASFLTPGLVALATHFSQSARIGIAPVILLFLIALVLLVWVNPKGERG